MLKSVWKFKQNMAKSHKTCMEQAEIIDTFGTYHVAALSRFISRLGKTAIPLYRLLGKTDNFVWHNEADEALESLKKQLTQAPILPAPKPKEPMLLYISANNCAVSVVFVVERMEVKKEYPLQRLAYYVSEVLTLSKQRYPHWKKTCPWCVNGVSETQALL